MSIEAAPSAGRPNEGRDVQTIGEALRGAGKGNRGGRRTGQPVRRHSRLAGRELGFWQSFDRRDVARFMLAAERFDRTTRKKGERTGAIGSVGLEVLRELLRLIDFRTGRLDPSLQTLCDRLRRSRDAVVRALAKLRAAGFVDWLRRYVPTGDSGRGPQVQQTSNAYRLTLPPLAAKLLGYQATPAPVPDDHRQRIEDAAAERRAMIAQLPLWEQPAQLVEDSGLAAILARFARGIAERESGKRPESGEGI